MFFCLSFPYCPHAPNRQWRKVGDRFLAYMRLYVSFILPLEVVLSESSHVDGEVCKTLQVHNKMFADIHLFEENPAHAHFTSVSLRVMSQTGRCVSKVNNGRKLRIDSVFVMFH